MPLVSVTLVAVRVTLSPRSMLVALTVKPPQVGGPEIVRFLLSSLVQLFQSLQLRGPPFKLQNGLPVQTLPAPAPTTLQLTLKSPVSAILRLIESLQTAELVEEQVRFPSL